MQFIKSLFCLQGFDNRPRFFTICSAIYILFIMLTSAFTNNTFIFVIFVALLTLVLSLTTLRRLHDAKLNKNWLLIPSLTFILVATIIIFSKQNSSYYLLFLPILFSAVLLTYRNNNKLHYILGYSGPVDMKEYQPENDQRKTARFRIEPTLISDNADSASETIIQNYEAEQNSHEQNRTSFNQQTDIGEIIRLELFNNKKAQLIVSVVVGLTLISFATSLLINFLNKPNPPLTEVNSNQQIENTKQVISRNHPLSMPDNYTLYLSEHHGISINWQADEVSDTTLWSQTTTQGDKSCKEISFNKGESIRTLSVQVENSEINGLTTNTNYFANFSPLDSKALIQALAFRSNFTLCGYNFSLKGSQAVIGRNEQYAQWLDN